MSEYQDIAYEHLGLSHDGHEIGTMRYSDLPDEVFYAVCARHLNNVRQTLYEMKHEPDWEATVRANDFLFFPEWRHIIKDRKYAHGNLNDPDWERRCDAIIENEFLRLHREHRYEPTFPGWQQYVCDASPDFAECLMGRFPVRIAESDCLRHAFIAASSGSGKSELCKVWCHSYREHPEYGALFVLDPGGDFTRQFAMAARSDRLVYIHPLLDLTRSPVINPFEIFGVDARDTSPSAIAVKRVVAQQLQEAFEEVIGEGQQGEVTRNMHTVLRACLLALLDYPDATVRDLYTFMDDKLNGELVAFGCTRRHYPDVQHFFEHSFRGEFHLTPTKAAIKMKLYGLLTGGIFANLTCGKSTINLEELWNDRKVVVFNLPAGDMALEANAFGRLVIALLQGIAKRRVNQPEEKRIPAHLIVDEMEFFLTRSMEEMLRFSRRYKLIFTGVQQIVGSGMSPDMRRAIIGNTLHQNGGMDGPELGERCGRPPACRKRGDRCARSG